MDDNMTMDLTIELDSPEQEASGDLVDLLPVFKSRDERLFGLEIGPPLSHHEIEFKETKALIASLSRDAVDLLSSHLNLPAIGSLRNWETVAACFGMDADKILGVRLQDSPTEFILRWARNKEVDLLIRALVNAKRVDTLLSLFELPLLLNPKSTALQSLSEQRNLPQAQRSSNNEGEGVKKEAILVTHEEAGDTAKRKEFNWLMKNLQSKCKMSGLELVDVETLAVKDSPSEALSEAFARARHVVMVASAEYTALLSRSETEMSEAEKLKSVLHKLMDAEFYNGRAKNKRFRVVFLQYSSKEDRPPGWPQSTLSYAFPIEALALFKRLFKEEREEEEKEDKMVTM